MLCGLCVSGGNDWGGDYGDYGPGGDDDDMPVDQPPTAQVTGPSLPSPLLSLT